MGKELHEKIDRLIEYLWMEDIIYSLKDEGKKILHSKLYDVLKPFSVGYFDKLRKEFKEKKQKWMIMIN